MSETTQVDADAVAWSHPSEARAGMPLVMFLHGIAGHERDWSAWFPALPEGMVGAALRAPVPLGGRWAWCGSTNPAPPRRGLRSAYSARARGVRAWLEGQHAEQVALVGWSQGGAVAVQMLRQQPDQFVATAVVAGFVANTSPHAGLRAVRPALWYGMGGRDDVISRDRAARSRRWLSEHTSATLVDFPDDGHLLSPSLVGGAIGFVAGALAGTDARSGSPPRGQRRPASGPPGR